MRVVPLSASPNQSFTLTVDTVRWGVRLVDAAGVMVADISRDGVPLLTGTRVLAGETLIPYAYLQSGNFIMLTDEDALPAWRDFNGSQALVYVSADEMATIRASPLSVGDVTSVSVSYLTTDDGFYVTTDTGELLTDD